MQQPNHAGLSHASPHLNAEACQQPSHKVGCAHLSKSQLRVLVQVPAPRYKLGRQALGLNAKVRNGHGSLTPP
jgi:hypothetical protein